MTPVMQKKEDRRKGRNQRGAKGKRVLVSTDDGEDDSTPIRNRRSRGTTDVSRNLSGGYNGRFTNAVADPKKPLDDNTDLTFEV